MTRWKLLPFLTLVLPALLAPSAHAQSFVATASTSGPAITMSWSSVSGATSYVVDAGLQSGSYVAPNLPATSTGFSVAAPFVGTFYLRARALNGTTVVATSNEVQVSVTTMVLTPTSVEAFGYCGGVLLRWSSGGGAPTGYRVSVTGAATASFTTTRTEFYAPSAPAGSYSFTVSALSGASQSDPSAPVAFTVGGTSTVPTPVVTSTVFGGFVRARWSPVPGATAYAIQALQNGGTVLNNSLPASVTSVQANGVGLGNYAIRVSATAACGAQSATGETTFVVDGSAPAGPRTPDPAPGQRLPLPSYGRGVVEALAAERPDLLYNSCLEHPGGNNRFMFEVLRRLRQQDTRWGLNWKRGNVGDMSQDIVTYHAGPGPDEGARTPNIYIIDMIGGHCGPRPGPNWEDVSQLTIERGAIGIWTLLPFIDAGFTP